MLGYICKYVPVKLFEAMGEEMQRIEPNITNYDNAEMVTHPNICSYIKGVYEEIARNDYDGIILTNCCDSSRRLFDILKKEYKDKFIYILDLPRKNLESSIRMYERSISNMIYEFESYRGKNLNFEEAKRLLSDIKKEDLTVKSSSKCKQSKPSIGIVGARCSSSLLDFIGKKADIKFDMSCTGDVNRIVVEDGDNVIYEYSKGLLNTFPCMRMVDISSREEFLKDNIDKVQGIIYNTIKFCDVYSYEYTEIKDILDIPILKIETDYTSKCEGQLSTRVEAFLEEISSRCKYCDKADNIKFNDIKETMMESIKNENTITNTSCNKNKVDNKKFYVLGIDSGSTSTNSVIMDSDKNIVSSYVLRTGAKSGQSAKKAIEDVISKAGLNREDISIIISTGYGRVSIKEADKNITEISCHGKGAYFLNNNIRTIIDIGGQDSKVIRLNDNGDVTDFVMNDKCAAGTGRFLEMMASTLEIDINDMGREYLKWKKNISISSMCTVFAESEVISLIADNTEKADIIHALCNSIAGKTCGLLGRVGKMGGYMMSGGVAKNIGVVNSIENKLGEKLYIPDEPEIVGAIGAALFGIEEMKK